MSYVTDVLVHIDLPREDQDGQLHRDLPFYDRYHPAGHGLTRLFMEDVPGPKSFQGEVYAGAFNYLDTDALIIWFIGLGWDWHQNAVMSVSSEHEYHTVVLIKSGEAQVIQW